jgi:hypothetical protein
MPVPSQQSLTFKMVADGVTWSTSFDPDAAIADPTTACANAPGWYKVWLVLRSPAQLGRTLGVHCYMKPWASLAVSGISPIELAIRFNNGVVNSDGSKFCGRIYFTSLQVVLATTTGSTIDVAHAHHGQTVSGGTVTIAADPGDGTTHVFEPRWILERRMVIIPAGGNASTIKTGIFEQGSLDVSTPAAAFGPHKIHLYKFDSFDTTKMATLCTSLKSNISGGTQTTLAYENGDLFTNGQDAQLGPWLMEDYPDGGAPAGYGINIEPGWEVDKNAVLGALLQHELVMARQPVACFERFTGAAMSPKSWTSVYLSHTHPMGGESGGAAWQQELPAFLVGVGNDDQTRYINFNSGTCTYEASLKAYRQHDPAHLVRAFRCAAVLAGYLGDAMAMDDLVMIARSARHYGWGDRHDEQTVPAYPGAYVPPSLKYTLALVMDAPAVGSSNLDRAFGHMLTANAWAGFAGDTEAPAWIKTALNVYTLAADIHGICQREHHLPYMPADIQGTQHFHTTITHAGAYTAAAALPNIDPASHTQVPAVTIVQSRWKADVLSNGSLPYEQRYDNNAVYGPPKWIGTFVDGGTEIALTTALSWGDDPAGPTGKNGFQEHSMAAAASLALGLYASNSTSTQAKAAVDACLGLETPDANNTAKLADVNPSTPMSDRSQWARWLSADKIAYP